MADDDSSKLRSILQQALTVSEKDRIAFLDEVCEDDVSLRGRVEELLSAIDDPATSLNNGPQV